MDVLKKGIRGDKTNNIAWYYSGYVNYIKKQSALPTRAFEEYFELMKESEPFAPWEQNYCEYLINN